LADGEDRRKFVVGLGNPGMEYAQTRHNVGFMVLESLRRRWNAGEGRRTFSGRLWDARPARPDCGARHVLLLAPHTFMNDSGRAVREMAAFYQADVQDLLVVLDDLALELGRLRIRAGGSAGGHNGLADVVAALGTEAAPRLRIGIGSAPGQMDPRDFVLSRFRPDELAVIGPALETAADAVEDWVFNGMTYAMDKYNRKSDG